MTKLIKQSSWFQNSWEMAKTQLFPILVSMHGYSKTPLARKLGIKEGFSIMLVNTPDHYSALFDDFPENVTELNALNNESLDFVHLFCTSNDCLEKETHRLKPLLKKTGMLWVSWPKGTSEIETDLNRDLIREYILSEIGLVDIKVAAIDADWSGLKFVYRTTDR